MSEQCEQLEPLTPYELVGYADKVLLVIQTIADNGTLLRPVEIQSLALQVDAARLAVELATLKLAMEKKEE